jgi:hypothetical protein
MTGERSCEVPLGVDHSEDEHESAARKRQSEGLATPWQPTGPSSDHALLHPTCTPPRITGAPSCMDACRRLHCAVVCESRSTCPTPASDWPSSSHAGSFPLSFQPPGAHSGASAVDGGSLLAMGPSVWQRFCASRSRGRVAPVYISTCAPVSTPSERVSTASLTSTTIQPSPLPPTAALPSNEPWTLCIFSIRQLAAPVCASTARRPHATTLNRPLRQVPAETLAHLFPASWPPLLRCQTLVGISGTRRSDR